MNKRYSIVVLLFAIISLMTSCLSDKETTLTYYDDAAITSFSLGTMNRTVNSVSSKTGKDTTYVIQFSGSSYTFTIDQSKGLIYNVDSLPEGTNTKKCLVTVGTRNSSIAFLKSLTSDSVTTIQSTDSLDFSQPRTIHVLSNDGTWKRDYTVELRMHTEKEEKLYWNKKQSSSQIAQLSNMKAIALEGNIYAFGMTNGAAKAYKTSAADGNSWSEVAVPFAVFNSVVTNGKTVYVLADNGIFTSTNGNAWTKASEAGSIKTLAGASSTEVYAIATDGKIVKSADKGCTWQYDTTDGDASFIPQQNVCGIAKSSTANPEVEKVIIIGNREETSDKTSMVWAKTVDNNNPAYSQPWIYQPFEAETWHHAPRFANMSVIKYADGILMLGAKEGSTDTTKTGFSLYYSWDEGLNWWIDKRYTLPDGVTCDPSSFAMVADNNRRFWILCGNSGEVWQGHYSTWTWK